MKSFIVLLAVVASACAMSVEDIPQHMKDRLDRVVALKKTWEAKWLAMNEDEKLNYEKVLLSRLEVLPKLEMSRLHDRLLELPETYRTSLLQFLRHRFPVSEEQTFADDIQEINYYIMILPQTIRESISQSIPALFQEATAYSAEEIDEDLNFPDIPDLVDIPLVSDEATGFSSDTLPEEVRTRVDEFLMKRDDWQRKWESLPEEKKERMERYISEKMAQ